MNSDLRVRQGRRELMLQAVAEHQLTLTGVRAADGERKIGYDALLKEFGEQRAGGLFFPYLGADGSGPLVELADGSVKFDDRPGSA